MKSISMGNKKKLFKSLKMAADANDINYITFYMRLRMGMPPQKAVNTPVRAYTKKGKANV